jgi:colicin import membrane protein
VPRKANSLPGGFRSAVLAILVHIVIGGIVVVGFRWTDAPPRLLNNTIQAVVVEDPEKRRLEEEQRQREVDERRQKAAQAERERLEREAEERRKAEELRRQQEQQRLAIEKKQKEEAEQKRQAELKRKQEEEKRKAETEKLKAEAFRKQEEDRRRKADEESLRRLIAAEEEARERALAQGAKSARVASEVDRYRALIERKIYDSWTVPSGLPVLRCVVRLRLLPGGVVSEPRVIESSGNAAFDRSAEAAVLKASPLPVSTDPDVFDQLRDISITMTNLKR